ncbi:hypothetical protein F8M41_011536 [Gigaspora margarita]|uniref:Uncharacterized protein n=1 Tax=Gigaspora margarita TaxID=4874 RepID=A0A8H4ATY1_GIGMA|nr:hypothetical protein F8M41_011536 [Gigaspora margarita]
MTYDKFTTIPTFATIPTIILYTKNLFNFQNKAKLEHGDSFSTLILEELEESNKPEEELEEDTEESE